MQCLRKNGKGDELVMAFTAGTLEPEAQIALERHLPECEECRTLVAQQKAVWDAMDEWKPVPVSPDFNSRLMQRISEDAAVAWWRRPLRFNWSWLFRPAIPVAAACAALVLAFLINPSAPKHESPVSPQQGVSIEQVERALDDMDMLKQISAPTPAESKAAERI